LQEKGGSVFSIEFTDGNSLGQILVDNARVPSLSTLAHGLGDRRIRHAGNDHLAADLAAHALTDAKSGRSILAEQPEAIRCRWWVSTVKLSF
jgi:hypothetical protein